MPARLPTIPAQQTVIAARLAHARDASGVQLQDIYNDHYVLTKSNTKPFLDQVQCCTSKIVRCGRSEQLDQAPTLQAVLCVTGLLVSQPHCLHGGGNGRQQHWRDVCCLQAIRNSC